MKRILIALMAIFAAASIAPGAAAAEPVQPPALEAAEEAGEEAEEATEEAAERAEAVTRPTPAGAPVATSEAAVSAALPPGFARRIEHLKELIAKYRADLKIVRQLPHSTKRWIEHRPRKRLHIKQCRARIHELRLRAAEARG